MDFKYSSIYSAVRASDGHLAPSKEQLAAQSPVLAN
ncbi:hypothetical protein L485_14130 [Sphingobium baderi LL03]|uniref:Uncharacterized protein n=1 Tax=Sphingobium baderi LL03 TaxID=1114964 RepID=T0GJ36_9SPHN|nr:hypothetical protein L485_14130 [Sphingobium baderi LL03]